MMNLPDYLRRIGYAGPVAPDIETLRALHRAHLLGIAYENLDLHRESRRELSLDVACIYDKIVRERRGGWCYEMNGLFAWVLREIGFAVTLLGSAVGRLSNPSAMEDSHILLKVTTPGSPEAPWIADVGFGNAFLEPLPLTVGMYVQDGLTYRLERDQAERWWFTNHMHGGSGFDFSLKPFALGEFAAPCQWLQTSPDSGFVRVPVCHRHLTGGVIVTLRALSLTTVIGEQCQVDVIPSAQTYAHILRDVFRLALPDDEIDWLWRRASQMHLDWLAQQNAP